MVKSCSISRGIGSWVVSEIVTRCLYVSAHLGMVAREKRCGATACRYCSFVLPEERDTFIIFMKIKILGRLHFNARYNVGLD